MLPSQNSSHQSFLLHTFWRKMPPKGIDSNLSIASAVNWCGWWVGIYGTIYRLIYCLVNFKFFDRFNLLRPSCRTTYDCVNDNEKITTWRRWRQGEGELLNTTQLLNTVGGCNWMNWWNNDAPFAQFDEINGNNWTKSGAAVVQSKSWPQQPWYVSRHDTP